MMEKTDLINYIVNCLEHKSLSVFLGSGMSFNACGLDWKTLVDPYISQLPGNDSDLIKGLQYYVTQNNINVVSFKGEIAKKFIGLKYDIRHEILAKLPVRNYWTTNFDTLIEDALKNTHEQRDVMTTNDSFITAEERRDNVVYKLHGDVNDPQGIVILQDDYENYDRSHCNFMIALGNELATNNMLFLGYSFSDPDIKNIIRILKLRDSIEQTHLFILKRESKDKELAQKYWIDELAKKGIITCLIDEYTEIEEILKRVYKKYMARKIFVSGSSCGDYGRFTKAEAHQLLYKLGYKLIDDFKFQDINLISGYGLGIGPNLIEGAAEAVANNDLDFGKRILIYPFPKAYYGIHSEDRSHELEQHFSHYREKMIDKCGVAFFLFGNKRDKDGNLIIADGVIKEFEIAHRQGKYVFPIGSTGGAAKVLADKVLTSYEDYNKTSLEVKKLYCELNLPDITADDIIDKVCDIINLLAYRDNA
ncbi:MAG: SIR2 family protein [Clostridia bacterium]|nr:SIR2 family protein [Clostridia bacterium]